MTAVAFEHLGQHEPIIYLCNGFFEQTPELGAQIIIHELLHVAGQSEDGTPEAGPGDPPHSVDISDAVAQACNKF